MKNFILLCAFILSNIPLLGQLSSDALEELSTMAELCAAEPDLKGKSFNRDLRKLKNPELARLNESLQAIAEGDERLLTARFLMRPTDEELMQWYLLQELMRSAALEDSSKPAGLPLAQKLLKTEPDTRRMLDAYYHMLAVGIERHARKEDLSDRNLVMAAYGLRDETERAIFFLNISDGLLARLVELEAEGNFPRIIHFADRLPQIDGQPYYKFRNFDFEDFKYRPLGVETLPERPVSYKADRLHDYYAQLYANFVGAINISDPDRAELIYLNSLLSRPEYFKYAELQNDLKDMYRHAQRN